MWSYSELLTEAAEITTVLITMNSTMLLTCEKVNSMLKYVSATIKQLRCQRGFKDLTNSIQQNRLRRIVNMNMNENHPYPPAIVLMTICAHSEMLESLDIQLYRHSCFLKLQATSVKSITSEKFIFMKEIQEIRLN